MNFVLGIEPYKMAQVWGIHSNKQKAIKQAEYMEKTKPELCCQRYVAMTKTEIKKAKYQLFA